MNFEKIPTPDSAGNEEELIKFEKGGRKFSMTPEEQEAHEEAEEKRKVLELELTESEQEMLVKMVPDAETRVRLGPEALRMLIDMKKEEPEEGKKKAA